MCALPRRLYNIWQPYHQESSPDQHRMPSADLLCHDEGPGTQDAPNVFSAKTEPAARDSCNVNESLELKTNQESQPQAKYKG